MKSAGLALALAAGLAGAIAVALLAPRPAYNVTGDASDARPLWVETKWPFPMDQWGTGRAFACQAAECGGEVKLYLRAKLGSCNCATGVADDADLDRMSDFDLVGGEVSPLGAGRPITIAWMKGRSRAYALAARDRPGKSATRPSSGIGFASPLGPLTVETVAENRQRRPVCVRLLWHQPDTSRR
jgi:hypothetical protein